MIVLHRLYKCSPLQVATLSQSVLWANLHVPMPKDIVAIAPYMVHDEWHVHILIQQPENYYTLLWRNAEIQNEHEKMRRKTVVFLGKRMRFDTIAKGKIMQHLPLVLISEISAKNINDRDRNRIPRDY